MRFGMLLRAVHERSVSGAAYANEGTKLKTNQAVVPYPDSEIKTRWVTEWFAT